MTPEPEPEPEPGPEPAPLPILYSFRRCPYAMRARMALRISGAAVEVREVSLRDKPPELIAVSPKATVPVLVDGDLVLEESLEIMRWALGRSDPEGWLTRMDESLIAANDGPFKDHLDRYKYAGRYGSDARQHRAAGMALLEPLDTILMKQPHLGGFRPGVTDIAIMPFVRQFADTERAWFDEQPLRHVQAWLEDWRQSRLFAAIMVKRDPWHGSAPTG